MERKVLIEEEKNDKRGITDGETITLIARRKEIRKEYKLPVDLFNIP